MTALQGGKTDDGGLKDSITVELNGEVIQGEYTLPPVPNKPNKSGPKSAWEEYAVALGLDPVAAADWDKDALVKWVG
jgi:hypothetical protein